MWTSDRIRCYVTIDLSGNWRGRSFSRIRRGETAINRSHLTMPTTPRRPPPPTTTTTTPMTWVASKSKCKEKKEETKKKWSQKYPNMQSFKISQTHIPNLFCKSTSSKQACLTYALDDLVIDLPNSLSYIWRTIPVYPRLDFWPLVAYSIFDLWPIWLSN